MDNKKCTFVIGGLKMSVLFEENDEDLNLIPSFKYFYKHDDGKEEPYIKVEVKRDVYKKCIGITKKVYTTNGCVKICRIDEGYRCNVYDKSFKMMCSINGNFDFTRCNCSLTCSDDKKGMALKTALLIIYINASSFKNRIMLHSSTVKLQNKAFCFIGESGEGKSTQSDLWVKNIPGCTILNDDNPILQLNDDGSILVWGSPWSGKSNYYLNDSAEMCAMVQMSHGKKNEIKRTLGIRAFLDLFSSVSCFPSGTKMYHNLFGKIVKVVEKYPIYEMSCLPNKSAAMLCYKTVMNIDKCNLIL